MEHQWQNNNEPVWNTAPPPKTKKDSWTTGKVVALTLCSSLLAGFLGAGSVLLYLRNNEKAAVSAAPQKEQISVLLEDSAADSTDRLMNAAQVYDANVNATVGITTSVTTNFWGYPTTSAASGSGFIISPDGYILTNYHVVEDSDAITVSCYDGTTYDGQIKGYDKNSDIAVLKVEATDLQSVNLGNSEKLKVGDSVVAIGNPLGELTFSLTAGTVSALDRQVTMSNGVTMDLIQTDCAINSGNSGGALFNLHGEVIGITNAKYASSPASGVSIDNIAFAIPVNDILPIVESIMEKGYVATPYIGVSVTDVSKEIQSYGLPGGAAVQAVAEESPADNAGLQKQDIITMVDGAAISGKQQLVETVRAAKIGDVLRLTVYRKGEILQLYVTVGEQIQNANEN